MAQAPKPASAEVAAQVDLVGGKKAVARAPQSALRRVPM